MTLKRRSKGRSIYAGDIIKSKRFGYYGGFVIDMIPNKPMSYIPFSRKHISCRLYRSVTYSDRSGNQYTIDYDIFRNCFLVLHKGRWKSI